MSETFKAICKKDVIFKYNPNFMLLKGKEYSYIIGSNNNNFIIKIVDDGNDHRCEFSEQDFNQHFYSITELRKLKLDKINQV